MPQHPTARTPPKENRFLAGLGVATTRRMRALCETVPLAFGQILGQADGPIRHVYFPERGFISVLATASTDQALEVGLIGTEGMLGATLALGVPTAPLQALVQGDGSALRMSAARFRAELDASPKFRQRANRYCYVLLRQTGQAAACVHYHAVPARLARWLLMTLDRTAGDELQLTQEFLSRMLGVRRVGITQAASHLQRAGLISYQRGAITVRDRRGLLAEACSCYEADRRSYALLLGQPFPRRSRRPS